MLMMWIQTMIESVWMISTMKTHSEARMTISVVAISIAKVVLLMITPIQSKMLNVEVFELCSGLHRILGLNGTKQLLLNLHLILQKVHFLLHSELNLSVDNCLDGLVKLWWDLSEEFFFFVTRLGSFISFLIDI